MSSNPIVRFGKLHGITAKEMSIGTGLGRTVCNDILQNPTKKVTPETAAAVNNWAANRIPDMNEEAIARSNITLNGRPGLTKNTDTTIRRKRADEICPTCYMAMPLTGICCDEEVHITS